MNENNDMKTKNDGKNLVPNLLAAGIFLALIVIGVTLVNQYLKNRNAEPDYVGSVSRVANLTTVQVQAAQVGVEARARSGGCVYWREYLINGVIEGGIDLLSVGKSDINCDDETSTCTITLPEPHVTLCQFSTIPYHDDKTLLCGNIDYDDLDQIAQYKTSRDIIQDVLAGDVVQRAKDETEVLMEGIFLAFGYDSVEIQYRPASDDAELLDDTCIMENPSGWEERNSGIWEKES